MSIGQFSGMFSILHTGHLSALRRAAELVDRLYIFVGEDNQFEESRVDPMGLSTADAFHRARWISTELRDLGERVSVHIIRNDYKHGDWDNWEETNSQRYQIMGTENPDQVFSAEESYIPILEKLWPQSQIITFDKEIDISSSRIFTEGIYRNWAFLPQSVRAYYSLIVTVCGPESVGKTILTQKLCADFSGEYLPEGGRIWWEKYGGQQENVFDIQDYLDFSYWRKANENLILEKGNLVNVFDTGQETTTMWARDMTQWVADADTENYQKCLEQLELMAATEAAERRGRGIYLLIRPNNTPTQDGTRVTIDTPIRERAFTWLQSQLEESGITPVILEGSYQENYLSAKHQITAALGR